MALHRCTAFISNIYFAAHMKASLAPIVCLVALPLWLGAAVRGVAGDGCNSGVLATLRFPDASAIGSTDHAV